MEIEEERRNDVEKLEQKCSEIILSYFEDETHQYVVDNLSQLTPSILTSLFSYCKTPLAIARIEYLLCNSKCKNTVNSEPFYFKFLEGDIDFLVLFFIFS